MLNAYGIYVFESKGGWIFGSENDSYWTQMFNRRNKYKVINPIVQNKNHIKYLENILHIGNPDVYRSYIVFSLRCELKKIIIYLKTTFVLKRNLLDKTLREDYLQSKEIFSNEQIDEIYNRLKPYMKVDPNVKIKRIQNISSSKH